MWIIDYTKRNFSWIVVVLFAIVAIILVGTSMGLMNDDNRQLILIGIIFGAISVGIGAFKMARR